VIVTEVGFSGMENVDCYFAKCSSSPDVAFLMRQCHLRESKNKMKHENVRWENVIVPFTGYYRS
jgi:hypothetical protein